VDAVGGMAYVANMDGTGLSAVNVSAGSRTSVNIPGGGHGLKVNPRGDRVFVTSQWGNVYMVDLATLAIVDTIVVGGGPWGLAFRSSGSDSLVYVTSRDAGTVTEADTKTGAVLRTFRTAGRPHGIAISPDGSMLYVADNTLGRVLYVRVSDGGITREIPVSGAFELALTPDGATLYVTTEPGNIVVVDVATGTLRRTYVTNGYPRQIVTSADGGVAWAANGGGWIDVVTR
jgi:YVTN family beta-propeller protein